MPKRKQRINERAKKSADAAAKRVARTNKSQEERAQRRERDRESHRVRREKESIVSSTVDPSRGTKWYRETSTKIQLQLLKNFMQTYPELAGNTLNTAEGKIRARKLWLELKNMLNEYGPPIKSLKEWRRVWTCLKYKNKKKLIDNNETIPQNIPVPKLQTETIIYKIEQQQQQQQQQPEIPINEDDIKVGVCQLQETIVSDGIQCESLGTFDDDNSMLVSTPRTQSNSDGNMEFDNNTRTTFCDFNNQDNNITFLLRKQIELQEQNLEYQKKIYNKQVEMCNGIREMFTGISEQFQEFMKTFKQANQEVFENKLINIKAELPELPEIPE